jgi:hypothetical protein
MPDRSGHAKAANEIVVVTSKLRETACRLAFGGDAD